MKGCHFTVGFNGHAVAVECGSAALAGEFAVRLRHAFVASRPPLPALVVRVTEPARGCVEARDSRDRSAAGSLDYVRYQVGKWIAGAFVDAEPGVLWMHASAVSLGGRALVLAGPAGAGKSTLAVHLIDRGWDLLGDDIVPVRPGSWEALPLPFVPEFRPPAGQPAWLDRPKQLAAVASSRVARQSASIALVVLPCYQRGRAVGAADRMSNVTAAAALAPQCSGRNRQETLDLVTTLAGMVPCYSAAYDNPRPMADHLIGLVQPHEPAARW